jgi:hypothetical protein
MSDLTSTTTADPAGPPAGGIDVNALAAALISQLRAAGDLPGASTLGPSGPDTAPPVESSTAPAAGVDTAPAAGAPAPSFAAGDVVTYRVGDDEGAQILYGLVIAAEDLTFTHPTDPAQNDSVPGVRVAWLHEISAPLRTTDLELA